MRLVLYYIQRVKIGCRCKSLFSTYIPSSVSLSCQQGLGQTGGMPCLSSAPSSPGCPKHTA